MKALRLRTAVALLFVVKAIAPVTLHAEATRAGRKVGVLAVGEQIEDVTALMASSTISLVNSQRPDMFDEDDDEEDDWDDDL